MNLVYPQGTDIAELLVSPSNLNNTDETAQPKLFLLCLLLEIHVGGIQEIFHG